MWAVGLVELGITDKDFWDMTPKMYDALLRHRIEMDKEKDYRASLTPWLLTSLYRDKDSPPPKLGAFLEKYFPRWKKRKKPKPQTAEEQLQTVRMADTVLNRSLNARDR